MNALIAIAVKSLIVVGLTLLALRLARGRSAAERSWIAHIGLLALLVLPFAPLAVPTLAIPSPMAAEVQPAAVVIPEAGSLMPPGTAIDIARAEPDGAPAVAKDSWSAVELASILYWLPAALLLGLTLLALGRLIALRARAEVLVDSHWLSALARAQKRMGFKHGTALLTSDDLPSPISWGLMRPVILLNSRAVEAADEAEAIIAHELAHVARLDWAKLLLARVVTALFWFNPFVWLLAREAHQLREEAADDSVLAADIQDTDYAQLLVGVARHECSGLLLGAHGVAPSKSSLARRIARVLDSTSARGPAPKSFMAGVFFGALAMATPLAAITLVPQGAAVGAAAAGTPARAEAKGYYPAGGVPLPAPVSDSVSTAVSGAVASAVGAVVPETSQDDAKEGAIWMKTLGIEVTPDYGRSLRAAAPQLGVLTHEDLIELKIVGVTPAYIHEIVRSGYRNLDKVSLGNLRAGGVSGGYIRGMAEAGYPNVPADKLVEMKMVGVTPEVVRRLQQEGYPRLTPDQLIEMMAVSAGLRKDDNDGS